MSATTASADGGEAPASRTDAARSTAVDELRIEHLLRGGSCCGRLSSGSMAPTIDIDDEVLVEPLVEPRRGMVVLFRKEGRLTVHRLVGRTGTGEWLEMGDRNDEAAPVAAEDLLGRVALVRKAAGTVRLSGARARVAGIAIAVLKRLQVGLAPSGRAGGLPGSGLALRVARRMADVVIRGAARPTESA